MNKLSYDYSRPYFSQDYFSNTFLQIELAAGKMSIHRPIPFTTHQDIIMVIIVDGSGRAVINKDEIVLKSGSMFIVNSFQQYMLIPDSTNCIVMWECHFSIAASMYVSACPYNPLKTLYMPGEIMSATLDEHDLQTAENLLSELEAINSISGPHDSIYNIIITYLYGILIKNMEQIPPQFYPQKPSPGNWG